MAEHKTVYLFTGDGQSYELPKTLVYWEELLGDKVIRIHRNALVFRHTLDSLIRLDDDENDEYASMGRKNSRYSDPAARQPPTTIHSAENH